MKPEIFIVEHDGWRLYGTREPCNKWEACHRSGETIEEWGYYWLENWTKGAAIPIGLRVERAPRRSSAFVERPERNWAALSEAAKRPAAAFVDWNDREEKQPAKSEPNIVQTPPDSNFPTPRNVKGEIDYESSAAVAKQSRPAARFSDIMAQLAGMFVPQKEPSMLEMGQQALAMFEMLKGIGAAIPKKPGPHGLS